MKQINNNFHYMIRISQRDPRWRDVQIGNSPVVVGSDGCLLTAIAMVRSKMYPYHRYHKPYVRPDEFARLDIFNADGEIIWAKIAPILKQSFGMEYLERDYSYFPSYDDKRLKAYCDNPDYGVCVEVLTKAGKRHWLALQGRSFWRMKLGWATNDPWDGRRLWKTVGWKATYVRIRGFVVFRKWEHLEKMTADE
jgi:hypothetical protein